MIAHNDGFALLTNEVVPSSTVDAPSKNTPVAVLYRYTNGQRSWKTFLGGPGVHPNDGFMSSPDLNGDLAYSEESGLYGAYFVVTAYSGRFKDHFGDSIQYVSEDGLLQDIPASSSWGCSHNTGIAFEAANAPPFASICAEDHGAIWLNTNTQGMNGVKISNENVINGATNEAMGGMSGSYSSLARFIGDDSYIFTWVSRGAKNLTPDTWRGKGFTQAQNRTVNRNVAIAQFSDKNTLVGPEAISTVGAADGDSQIKWITTGSADCSNAHVATLDGTNALVSWEEIGSPTCPFQAMGCKGTFTGSFFQVISNGEKVGPPVKSNKIYVAGDMVTMPDGKICWPYVNMDWRLDTVVRSLPRTVSRRFSFACMGLNTSPPSTATGQDPAMGPALLSTQGAIPEQDASSTSILLERASTTVGIPGGGSSGFQTVVTPTTTHLSSLAPSQELPLDETADEASSQRLSPKFSNEAWKLRMTFRNILRQHGDN